MDNSDFVRADSSNLPKVDAIMLMEFMKNSDKHNIAEIRGVKALMSARESYVESAVGYVGLKRTGSLCEVKAKVVAEHRLSNSYYNVIVHLNDLESTIIDTSCDGCAAAAGGCKHTLVLLYWLQRRSSEPASTSVQCYWVKPALKRANEDILECKELFGIRTAQMAPKNPAVLENFLLEASKHSSSSSRALILAYSTIKPETLSKCCIFDIMVDFLMKEKDHTFPQFKEFSMQAIQNYITRISEETNSQVNSKLWHCMRQGRITGSKLYEVAHCKTPGGSLVQEVLGGLKVPETKAMKRGKLLEKKVIKHLEEKLNKEIKECGFILINGIFGASPDGITEDFVVEVKCPAFEKTKKNYVLNGQISKKCMGQVQLEMLAAKKNKCLFCVADPSFEQNGKIDILEITYDENLLKKLMDAAEVFWQQNIFPVLLKSANG